jgi:hypothetical protein
MIQFDPDDFDVTTDPEYRARVAAIGPVNNVCWAPDGKASAAKRLEMLDIDREMNDAWLVTMGKLYAQELTDAEFTTKRMLHLRQWTKERKRRQHNLHFKYDPTRRNGRLVNRDVDKQLEKVRAHLESVRVRRPDLAPEGWEPPTAAAEPPRQVATRPVRQSPALDRPLAADRIPAPLPPHSAATSDEGFSTFEDMVSRDTGIADPAAATDDQILAAYAERTSTLEPAARWYLAKLRGRPLPQLIID